MNEKKKIATVIGMVVLTIALIIVTSIIKDKMNRSKGSEASNISFAMGTTVSSTIYGNNESDYLMNKCDEISDRIKSLDETVISWRSSESELFFVNNSNSNSSIELGDELKVLTEKTLDIADKTCGALDPTIRPILDEWNIEAYSTEGVAEDGSRFSLPNEENLRSAKKRTGFEHVKLEGNFLLFDQPLIMLDFGSTGKGYALDRIYEDIKADKKITGGVFAVGGSIMVYGSKADNSPFKVGIRNPKGDVDDTIGYIQIPSKANTFGNDRVCISTSGSYEKYVDYEGKIYHHIIDRNTMSPVETNLVSVTIICEDGLISDGLSTACFVLGYEKSFSVLKEYNAEAVFVFDDDTVVATEGIENMLHITKDSK